MILSAKRGLRLEAKGKRNLAFGILGAIGLTPTQIENIIVSIFGIKGTAVMTNVPGPRQPLYMVGQKINGLMFWVPTPASLSMGVSIFSYAEEVVLGVATDESSVGMRTLLGTFLFSGDGMAKFGDSIIRRRHQGNGINPVFPQFLAESADDL
jgi:hypothetical protein